MTATKAAPTQIKVTDKSGSLTRLVKIHAGENFEVTFELAGHTINAFGKVSANPTKPAAGAPAKRKR